jgi:phage host-nuclease inhibitor protein Gam
VGLRRSPRVFLIGIEAGQMTAGAALSPAVERAVDYCEAHFDELRGYAERGETAMVSVTTMAAQHRVLSPESRVARAGMGLMKSAIYTHIGYPSCR